MRIHTLSALGLSAILSALLVACGGGGSAGGTVDPVNVTLTQSPSSAALGTSFVVSGSIVSQPAALSTMGWSISKLTTGATDVAVANGDCATGSRSTKTLNGITQSTWACDAVLTAPASLATNATYRVTFTGTDAGGNSATAYKDFTIGAGGPAVSAGAPVATAQPAVTVSSGADIGLSCFGAGGTLKAGSAYVYSWVIKSNPNALPVSLVVGQDGSVMLKAPQVATTSTLTLECRVTDDAPAAGVADTVVTITPNGTSAAVANAGSAQTVAGNATVQLDGSQSASSSNSVLYYNWTQTEGPTVALSDAASAKPSFLSPMVSGTTRLTFRLVTATTSPASASTATASEMATVAVYVTPQTPLSLAVTGSSVVSSSTAVSMTVTANTTDALYYQWTQVSGPTVTIGGATTRSASFISPTVSGSYVDLHFMVQVSRKPIAQSLPSEIASADVVVRTNP